MISFRLFHLTLLLGVTLSMAEAQIVIDFRANKITGTPAEINVKTPVAIRVINVNQLLYAYSVNVQGTPRQVDAFASISDLLKLQSFKLESPDPTCDAAFRKALTAAQKIAQALPQKVSAKYESLSQEEFRTRWRNADAPGYFAAMAELIKVRRSCNALAEVDRVLQTFQRDEARMRLIESQLETVSTELTATGSLDPNNDYTISITEHWRELDTGNTVDTVKSPQVHAFSPKTSIFTLSAGFLATRIDARKYVRRAVPGGADSDPVGNVLEVEGANKLRPTGIALLNFQIPRIGSDEIGLAFSVGPTVRIGAANDTSNLGVFAGPSLHLWRLIYLTAGWHLAEFADFPPGFFPGRAIPSNFQGDPQPLKRWTGRFGFAITFRTKDFGSIDKVKPTASQNTAEKKPETTKSETAKPAEAPKAENSKVDPNNPTPVPQPKK